MKITGIIYEWNFINGLIHGRMEEHQTRPDFNGHNCQTSPVLTIFMKDGGRYAGTKSGSTYKLID